MRVNPASRGLTYTERYRSGHNGPDSKSGSPQGLVGSNPTRSAKQRRHPLGCLLCFVYVSEMKNPAFRRNAKVLRAIELIKDALRRKTGVLNPTRSANKKA